MPSPSFPFVYLASQSPRRQELLQQLGVRFELLLPRPDEDAEALVEALKKKQYPAFTANNSTGDKFYHVQVGPYTELKDAEAMRARLIGDGYNPIVKK